MRLRKLLLGTSFRAVLGEGAGRSRWSRRSGRAWSATACRRATSARRNSNCAERLPLAGFALTHSLGAGTAAGAGRSYALGSAVTTALPFARLRVTERLAAWGLAGTGTGALTLDLDGAAPADAVTRHRAGLSMQLAAVGVQGDLLTPSAAGGFALAVKADAFRVRTESDAVPAPGVGNLAASRADCGRCSTARGRLRWRPAGHRRRR